MTGVSHRTAAVNGTELHYVSAGAAGSPILLVHGFPESSWTFHEVMPRLAATHRVFAVDLRGFGDSGPATAEHSSAVAAEDLHHLIEHLGVGPVHLTGQDISGGTVVRLAATHPEDVASLTAIEMGLAGYGLEAFADVTRGGAWYIGVLTAPGIPEMLLTGREREFLSRLLPAGTDVTELARTYGRPGGWSGAIGLYTSMLAEGDELRALAASTPLSMPTLAIGSAGGGFTESTLNQVSLKPARGVLLEAVGHYVALEAPDALAAAILDFVDPLTG